MFTSTIFHVCTAVLTSLKARIEAKSSTKFHITISHLYLPNTPQFQLAFAPDIFNPSQCLQEFVIRCSNAEGVVSSLNASEYQCDDVADVGYE
jgi:hypothetical protein